MSECRCGKEDCSGVESCVCGSSCACELPAFTKDEGKGMEVTCRECGKSYDSEMQVLCAHETEDGRVYFINMMYEHLVKDKTSIDDKTSVVPDDCCGLDP